MKSYNIQNYVRYKNDIAQAIKRIPDREDFNKLYYVRKRNDNDTQNTKF